MRKGEPLGIVEEKDCSTQEKNIRGELEGLLFQRKAFQEILPLIDNSTTLGGIFLTDAVQWLEKKATRQRLLPWSGMNNF